MFGLNLIDNLFAFVGVLLIIVVVHEYGHYLLARLCGVYVETFSVGFGKQIVSFIDRNKTKWMLSWIPLGGYVRIRGQEASFDESALEKIDKNDGSNFTNKNALQKILIVAAGPVFNIILAFVVIFSIFIFYGRPDLQPTVGNVIADSPAAIAGLMLNDKIVSVDNKKIASSQELVNYLTDNQKSEVVLGLENQKIRRDVNVTLGEDKKLGIMLTVSGDTVKIPTSDAFLEAGFFTGKIIKLCVVGVKQLIMGKEKITNLGGVIQIAQTSGDAARHGVKSFLSLIAMLSINLAILNLLPIPGLDGGYLVFYILDLFFIGQLIKPKVRGYAVFCGFALLLGLMVFANLNDIFKLIRN